MCVPANRGFTRTEIQLLIFCYDDNSAITHEFRETPNMLTHVEFRSDDFSPIEGEEELINPGLWGKRLADFIRVGLLREGFDISEPIAEDWGWMLKVRNHPFSIWIGCGHYAEYEDGYLCFIEPHKPYVWRLLRRIDTRECIAFLQKAVDKVLSEHTAIRGKRWWTHEEFNFPSRLKAD